MTTRHPAAIMADMSRRQRAARDDLAAELDEMAHGWWHRGNDRLSEASVKGADALRNGASSVRVGHTLYEVDETGDGSHT